MFGLHFFIQEKDCYWYYWEYILFFKNY